VIPDADSLTLAEHGAERHRAAIDPGDLDALARAVADFPQDRAGVRLHGVTALAPLLPATGAVGAVAAAHLGRSCRPVRALLLDKSAAANWSLPWHQDRTIVVAERRAVEGFGPWSVKAGLIHVAPPAAILEGMLTLRVHLDPVGVNNAPLLIAPASHRLGRVAEADIPDVVESCGRAVCLAEAGDVWAYATLILHASEVARAPARRRVLQLDYAADELPGGLRWLGV
jgi:hypothetical protein